MTSSKSPKAPKKQPVGDYAGGYCRPPKHGQIKPGEVRNPHGRNGAPKAAMSDGFAAAMAKEVPITIGGETFLLPAEHALWLKHTAAALAGNVPAFKVIAAELWSRRLSGVSSTREEIEARIETEARTANISAKFIAMLTEMATQKKAMGTRQAIKGEPD